VAGGVVVPACGVGCVGGGGAGHVVEVAVDVFDGVGGDVAVADPQRGRGFESCQPDRQREGFCRSETIFQLAFNTTAPSACNIRATRPGPLSCRIHAGESLLSSLVEHVGDLVELFGPEVPVDAERRRRVRVPEHLLDDLHVSSRRDGEGRRRGGTRSAVRVRRAARSGPRSTSGTSDEVQTAYERLVATGYTKHLVPEAAQESSEIAERNGRGKVRSRAKFILSVWRGWCDGSAAVGAEVDVGSVVVCGVVT
jgi:hypothetical protein